MARLFKYALCLLVIYLSILFFLLFWLRFFLLFKLPTSTKHRKGLYLQMALDADPLVSNVGSLQLSVIIEFQIVEFYSIPFLDA